MIFWTFLRRGVPSLRRGVASEKGGCSINMHNGSMYRILIFVVWGLARAGIFLSSMRSPLIAILRAESLGLACMVAVQAKEGWVLALVVLRVLAGTAALSLGAYATSLRGQRVSLVSRAVLLD